MTKKVTPLMEQYFSIKSNYSDALLFFQVGDFYELFFDDALVASRFLAITLTKRGKNNGEDIPLCGVPVHTVGHYLVKLVRGGFTVAICDQVSKPQPGTVVERAVTKVYSPGTLTELDMLDTKTASYLCICVKDANDHSIMLLFIEVLTAQMTATIVAQGDLRSVETELARYMPDEIVLDSEDSVVLGATFRKWGYTVSSCDIDEESARDWCKTFAQGAAPLVGVARKGLSLVHSFLHRSHAAILAQLTRLSWYEPESYVVLDAATQRNLALLKNTEGSREHSVFWALDATETGMGARLLKKWLVRPLKDQDKIEQRLDVVAQFRGDVTCAMTVKDLLKQCADLERIIGRCALGRATIGDYVALRATLSLLPAVADAVVGYASQRLIAALVDTFGMYGQLHALLVKALHDEPTDELCIAEGYCSTLDTLRARARNGQSEMHAYALQEGQAHGIATMKVLYTGVSGYFLEVTKVHTGKVPDSYIHVQTLANRVRYTTPELQALERALTTADAEAQDRQELLFQEIKDHVATWISSLRRTASSLATLDVLTAFAHVATTQGYCRPAFHTRHGIAIEQGRHCVIEQVLSDDRFMANDTVMGDDEYVWMVTGPNMGGKSTYLRQVALIHVLAQCGSFVPAVKAALPLVDRIFTRIGAGDNLAQGKSTFLVEMEETASICAHATSNSLVILDEVGRGTSSDDGRAIAQALIEFLVQRVKARTLFATHYHELTTLSVQWPSIKNYHFTCEKEGDRLTFLHTIHEGAASSSFGVDVAKMAGLPEEVILRAKELLVSS